MSKELEALERIKNHLSYIEEDYEVYAGSDLSIIETALKEYEKSQRIVETTTVSEALKQFLIQQCPEVEKQLKALEIIKKKGVDIWALKNLDDECYLEQYNALAKIEEPYTEEEYRLLDEVLL